MTADVATIEMRFAGGEVVSAATIAGTAYRGRFAGRVRFVLTESRTLDEPFLIRLRGADGRVLGAISSPVALAPLLQPPVTFASGRAGGDRWRAQAFVDQRVRATPLEPDRLERVTCVGLAPFRRETAGNTPIGPRGLRAQACVDEGPLRGAVVPGFDTSCTAVGTALVGIVAPRVARVVAVLGDGRRRTIAVHALPAVFGADRHAFAFAAGRDTAVRRLELRNARGDRIRSVDVALAPGSLRCRTPSSADFGIIVFSGDAAGPGGSELTPPPGPPRLLVADQGARLCFSIGRFGPDGADCDLPPVEPFQSRILRQTTAAGTLVAGVVPAGVARVRVRLSGGAAVVVPTTPTVPGYTGRYAGAVRFFTLPLDRPRRAIGVDLLGANGRRRLEFPGPDLDLGRTVTVLRAGGVRIGAGAVRRIPCISVGTADCSPALGDLLAVTATCVPRRIVVTAVLDRRSTGVDVVLRDGRTVRARVVRLPAAAGRRRLAVAVLPAAAEPVRAIVRRGSARPETGLLSLPAAARQCGYFGFAGVEVGTPGAR